MIFHISNHWRVRTKKIMVVDDDPDLIFSIKSIFDNGLNQYEITGINSGEECLAALNKNVIPDLIILDIMLPAMSGWELIKNLKRNPTWKTIPVIFLTGRDDRVAVNMGRFIGDDYIIKPFKKEDLIQSIENLIEKK